MMIPGAGLGLCSRRVVVSNCGYGSGYGYGYGFGYGLGFYGLGYGWNGLYPLPTDGYGYYAPDSNGYMDMYGGYVPEPGQGTPPNSDANPPQPDEVGPAANPAVPTQIILKGGTAYAVKSYWVSNGELYYQPVTGGLSHVPVDQLDLAATLNANAKNGVPFTLTDRSPHN